MSFDALKEKMDRSGFAHALMYLDKTKHMEREGTWHNYEGRIEREPPSWNENLLKELGEIFKLGWGDLGERAKLEALEPEKLTPLTRQLLSEGDRQNKPSHMLHLPYLGTVSGLITPEGLEKLLEKYEKHFIHLLSNRFTVIEPIYHLKKTVIKDPCITWGLIMMGAPDLWAMGFTGTNIKIAHLDTGVDSTHPALQGIFDEMAIFDLDGILSTAPITIFSDTGIHGTHTAGTLVAQKLANEPIVGMAPDARLISAVVINDGDTDARILSGLAWVLGKGARVVNLSIHYPGWDPVFEPAIETLREYQMLPVVSSGNYANQTCSPGNYPSSFSVGAAGSTRYLSPNSSYQQQGLPGVGPVLSAPGVGINSTENGGGYIEMTGSSMAAPHIAGLAALLFDARPQADIDQVQQAIVESCLNLVGEDPVKIGAGIPYGPVALQKLDQILGT